MVLTSRFPISKREIDNYNKLANQTSKAQVKGVQEYT